MVRLWPKLAVAAVPEYVIEFRVFDPIDVEASSMTVLASCANATTGTMVKKSAVNADVFRLGGMLRPTEAGVKSDSDRHPLIIRRLRPCRCSDFPQQIAEIG